MVDAKAGRWVLLAVEWRVASMESSMAGWMAVEKVALLAVLWEFSTVARLECRPVADSVDQTADVMAASTVA
jgi:hypothetical protein